MRGARTLAAARNAKVLDDSLILGEAAVLVDREGIDNLTLARVADRLGVTQSALYRHIDGADDLLRRLALRGRRQLLNVIRDAAVGCAASDALVAVAGAWRTFVHQHPGVYAATDRSPLSNDQANEAALEQIVTVTTQVTKGFGLDDEEARQAAWAIRSAIHGFVTLEMSSGNPASLELDHAFDQMVSLLAAGLHQWKSHTR